MEKGTQKKCAQRQGESIITFKKHSSTSEFRIKITKCNKNLKKKTMEVLILFWKYPKQHGDTK